MQRVNQAIHLGSQHYNCPHFICKRDGFWAQLPLSHRSGHSLHRFLLEGALDNLKSEIQECRNETRPLTPDGGLSRLDRVVQELNSGFRVPAESVAYVATADHFPSIDHTLPGLPVTSGVSAISGGASRRSQRLATKPPVSHHYDSGRQQWPPDNESEHRIRTRELVVPHSSFSPLQPRPNTPVWEERCNVFSSGINVYPRGASFNSIISSQHN